MATRRDDLDARTGVSGAQVALVVVGLVVILLVLWLLFLRGGDDPTVTAPPVAPAATPEPEAPEAARKDRRTRPLETFEVFAPKDPFRPLISAAAATGGTATGAPAGSGTAEPGVGHRSGGSDISGGQGAGGESVGGHRVRLIDTFRRNGEARARVQVDGTVYTVAEGERFADNFELLSVSGECASMLFGDDQFSLCEGEEILK